MMWRHGSFDASDLNTDCNADDAQIASLIRINGLRSIFDSEASFTDFAPSTVEGQRRQNTSSPRTSEYAQAVFTTAQATR